MPGSSLVEEPLHQGAPTELPTAVLSQDAKAAERVAAFEALLEGPSGQSVREQMGHWVVQFLPVERLVPKLLRDRRDPRIRRLLSVDRIAEDRLMRAICRKFGLKAGMPSSVIAADKRALATEFRDVTTMDDPDWIAEECGVAPISDYTIFPWPPAVAEDRFLRRFSELNR